MELSYLNHLKEIDTKKVASEISLITKSDSLEEVKGDIIDICIAYVLYQKQLYNNINVNSFKDFSKTANLSNEIETILKRNIYDNWDFINLLDSKFSKDELLSYILFDNSNEKSFQTIKSTPSGILTLAHKILDIKPSESVLDLCSGKGNFAIEGLKFSTGNLMKCVDLNFIANEIGILRTSLVDNNIEFVIGDMTEFSDGTKYDKIFSHYPTLLNKIKLNDEKKEILNQIPFSKIDINRITPEWVFNISIVNQMNDTGKAVALMVRGSGLFNISDFEIRKYFVDNGLIEAIIMLPSNLIETTIVTPYLIVFSNNNNSIKMIDAREEYILKQKKVMLDYQNIENIFELLNSIEKTIDVPSDEIVRNRYNLNLMLYNKKIESIKNGVKLQEVIKSVSRGIVLNSRNQTIQESENITNYKILKISDIDDGIIQKEKLSYIDIIDDNVKARAIKNNSFIISKTWRTDITTCIAQIDNNEFIFATQNLFVVELDENKINPYYLQAFFSSDLGKNSTKQMSTGLSINNINIDQINNIIIPLPSMEIQKEIGLNYAAVLDELAIIKFKLEKTKNKIKEIANEVI